MGGVVPVARQNSTCCTLNTLAYHGIITFRRLCLPVLIFNFRPYLFVEGNENEESASNSKINFILVFEMHDIILIGDLPFSLSFYVG